MKIVHIIPGSGGSFYCGNCLRDSKYFVALQKLGHDVIKVPMYLPLFSHEEETLKVPVFYGAVSLYLKQQFPILEKLPAWFDSLLNSKPMLRLAARNAGSTRAKGLEEMTISMLLGEKGQQHEELDKLVKWLKEHFKPDVVHLSNALLLGLTHQIKTELGVPIVCSLQDEDVWVDVMSPASRDKVWELMTERGREVDRFISVSNYFTDMMRVKMAIPDDRVSTIHLGVDPADYHVADPASKPRSIGFLSRMCYENGLDILVDAFIILKQKPENADVTLTLSGGHTGDDSSLLRDIKRKLKKNGLTHSVVFLENFEDEGRRKFFDSVSVLSVPVRNGEAFGIYLTEALASGVPIVQPALGAFPEVVKKSGAGVIYSDNTPENLASTLHKLLNDKPKMMELSLRAAKSVEADFNIYKQANLLAKVYQAL